MANEFITRRGIISLGGVTLPYYSTTTDYVVTDNDHLIDCSGTFNITLPTAVGVSGKIYIVKNSGSGTITIDTTSSQTIDGSLTKSLSQNDSIYVTSNGTNWLVSGVSGTSVNDGSNSARWILNPSTAVPNDPGSTYFMVDNADLSTVTTISISSISSNNSVYANWLKEMSANYVTLKITEVNNNSISGTYYLSPEDVTWYANYTDITLGTPLASNGSITSGNEYSISWVINGTPGSNGANGTSGVNGTSGTGFNTISNPANFRILSASGSSTNNAVANNNLTYDGSTLTVTGNATVSGTSSNLIRRSYGLVAFDTEVNLDDIYASVTDAGQLRLRTPGTWRATGWTETFKVGSPTVQNWINLNISGSGYGSASESMSDLQGYGCRCIIGDQSPSAKLYSITVVNLGATGDQWAIAIERLV